MTENKKKGKKKIFSSATAVIKSQHTKFHNRLITSGSYVSSGAVNFKSPSLTCSAQGEMSGKDAADERQRTHQQRICTFVKTVRVLSEGMKLDNKV